MSTWRWNLGRWSDGEANAAWRDVPVAGDGDGWAEPMSREFWRARSEEARLLEENKRQAEQIKALADAGEEVIGSLVLLADGDERAGEALAQSAGRLGAALRLVGRIK